MAFIFLRSKKINAGKRFGKKGWSLRRGKRTDPAKGLFPLLKYRPLLGTELNFYCCCINSRLLIFSTANKNLYKKKQGICNLL